MKSSAPSTLYWFTSVKRSPVIITEQAMNEALLPIIDSIVTHFLARGLLIIICSVSPVSRLWLSPWYCVSLGPSWSRCTASEHT